MNRDKDVPRLDWWPDEKAGACPEPGTLAGFVDGTLGPDERARVAGHVAGCARCYEAFAGIVDFQQDEEAPATKARVAPWWLAAAAVLAVVIAGGLLLRPRAPGLPEPGGYLAALGSRPSTGEPWPVVAFRGAAGATPSPSGFEIGVLLVDAQALAARGDAAGARPRFARLAQLVDAAGFLESEGALFREASQASTETIRAYPPRLVSMAGQLGERFDRRDLLLGSWAEAGRLAALAHDVSFFTAAEQRAILDDARTRQGLGADAARALQDVADRWPGGRGEPDWAALGDAFSRLVEARVR